MNLKTLSFFLMISCLTNIGAFCQNSGCNNILNLSNTVWSGNDSEGDFHEFSFFPDGHLTYRASCSGKDTLQHNSETDMWFQNGNKIIFIINNYVTYSGEIDGDKLVGISWNIVGKKWTWTWELKSQLPIFTSANSPLSLVFN